MDNSLAISMLSFFLTPLILIFAVQFSIKMQKKAKKDVPRNLIGINSQYELEKSIRFALCSNNIEFKDEIINIFENFFIEKRINGNKLQAIWAANYCLFTLKNESLAKIKLAKTKNIFDFSLESNYQEYLCNKNISSSSVSQITQFSNYFTQLYWVKKEDKRLCINLFNFWNEITSLNEADLRKLKIEMSSINEKILDLSKKYQQLFIDFPNYQESLSLYATYTKDIIYEYEKSNLIEAKLKTVEKSLSNPNSDINISSLFNFNNGILIISHETENFDEILYANKKSKFAFEKHYQRRFFQFYSPLS